MIDSIYNSTNWTIPCIRPKIIHFAAVPNYEKQYAYKKYEAIELEFAEEEEQNE